MTAYHIRNSTDIVLWVRTENGKKKVVVRGFVPYFYVPSSDGKYLSLDCERVKKIVCNCPEDVPKLRERYTKHYEANILFVHRFMIDKGIFEGVKFDDTVVTPDQISPYNCDDIDYNLCYFDIEVANKGTPITPEYVERAPDPVICFTIYTKGKYLTVVWRADFKERYEKVADNWYILYRSNERDLLYDFASIIDKIDPDVLIAWNSTSFDLPYLKNRMKQYDIKLDWSKFADFDLMRAYASFVLNKKNKYIGLKEAVVNEGIADKDEVKEFDLNWWRFDIDSLLKYNRDDVKYMVQIDAKRGLFSGARDRRFLAGLPSFNDTFYPRSLIDSACLREAKEQCVVLPTYPLDKKAESYEGGEVLEPAGFGVYKNVAVFDFSRYYPSIMFSFYLDPLIYYIYKRETGKVGNKFDLREYLNFAKPYVERGRTILLNALSRFMQLRDKIDERIATLEPGTREYDRYSSMKQSVKAIINGFYGTSGDGDFRLFTMPIATTVTAIGREGIVFTKHFVEKEFGFRVVYGDTDSVMVQVPSLDLGLMEKLANSITENINEYFASKYGVETNIKIKFEKFFKAVFFKEVKKRYAYWCTFEDGKECDYIGFKGFELVRGDSSPFIKRMQEEMFEIILKKDPSELVSWLPKIVKEFRSAKLSEIAIPKGLNKSFDSYDSMQSFVRGAIYANTYLGETITPGRTVYMLYVRSVKGKPRTDVVSLSSPEKFDELADIIEVDWDRMIEFSIRNKVEEIFKKFGLPFSISGRQLTL